MRRHLRFFENHVLAHYGIILLELQLVGLRPLILIGVIGKAGAGRRNQSYVVAHDRGWLAYGIGSGQAAHVI